MMTGQGNPKSGVLGFDVRKSHIREDTIFRAKMWVALNGDKFRVVKLPQGNVKVLWYNFNGNLFFSEWAFSVHLAN